MEVFPPKPSAVCLARDVYKQSRVMVKSKRLKEKIKNSIVKVKEFLRRRPDLGHALVPVLIKVRKKLRSLPTEEIDTMYRHTLELRFESVFDELRRKLDRIERKLNDEPTPTEGISKIIGINVVTDTKRNIKFISTGRQRDSVETIYKQATRLKELILTATELSEKMSLPGPMIMKLQFGLCLINQCLSMDALIPVQALKLIELITSYLRESTHPTEDFLIAYKRLDVRSEKCVKDTQFHHAQVQELLNSVINAIQRSQEIYHNSEHYEWNSEPIERTFANVRRELMEGLKEYVLQIEQKAK